MAEKHSEYCTFKFNFPDPENVVKDNIEERAEVESCEIDWSDSVLEVDPAVDPNLLKNAESICSCVTLGSHSVRYLNSTVALEKAKSEGKCEKLIAIDANKSDLEPGVYEGGFKTWECAFDLADFLAHTSCTSHRRRLQTPSVLELGCGSGLPGLLAYLTGCDVTFQDFNREVLEYLTIPNVFLNTSEEEVPQISKRCTFLSGHWQGIRAKYYGSDAKHKKYDVILSSETIYNKNNHQHLLELMKLALKPSGIIYVAAKTHYFGVGGTLHDFTATMKADGTFKSKIVHEFTDGVQRKILSLQFRKRKHGDSSQ